MPIQFTTLLNTIPFTSAIEDYWNSHLVAQYSKNFNTANNYYSSFKEAEKLPLWENFQVNNNIYQLFDALLKFHRLEYFDFEYHTTDSKSNNQTHLPSSYLSIQMIDLLEKEGINFSSLMLVNDHNNDQTDFYEHYCLHLQHLNFKQHCIEEQLSDKFLESVLLRQSYSYHNVDRNVELFFMLLEATPKETINLQWFTDKLELFCTLEDREERELLNHSNFLNFTSQKHIYDYMQTYFPENIEDNQQYYKNLIPSDIFSSNILFQGMIKIDLFQYMLLNDLSKNKFNHLENIAKESLNIISSDEFMSLHDNLSIVNIHHKTSKTHITLFFSCDNHEDLVTFEKNYITTLHCLFKVQDKIYLNWSENYHGEDTLDSNMDAQFINKYYLASHLHNTLDNDLSKPNKKNKI